VIFPVFDFTPQQKIERLGDSASILGVKTIEFNVNFSNSFRARSGVVIPSEINLLPHQRYPEKPTVINYLKGQRFINLLSH
tara:strand:- start:1710 stop:1952 length:243 start_codon:yes stop_codon:yes gene_type:complete